MLRRAFLALVLVLSPLLVGCLGDVEAACRVGGILAGGSQCTFTNKGSLPGQACVRVSLLKVKPSPGAPVGLAARSNVLCSGTVWGGSTTVVPVTVFDREPLEVCGGDWDNCKMDVARSAD